MAVTSPLELPNLTTPSPITLALAENPIPVLRRVAVEVTDEQVVLTGQLPSYYLKQLAQESVMGNLAGRQLFNRIQVVRDPYIDLE